MEQFKNDMLLKYGIDLEKSLIGEISIQALYTRTRELLILEIQERCPSFREEEDLANYENIIYKAVLEQAYYVLNNTDFSIASGIDFQTGQIMPINEIRKRQLSPIAKRILTNAGLFYAGMGYHEVEDYRYKRGY